MAGTQCLTYDPGELPYDAGQRNKDQVKRDIQTGRDRAQNEAEKAKARAGSDGHGGAVQAT